MHSFKYLFAILILTPAILFPKIYEDAENKNIIKWIPLQGHAFGTIRNIHDQKKKSRVIQFVGEGTKSAYQLSLQHKSSNTKSSFLSWEMNYHKDFVIMIELNTTKGVYTLIYTPGDEDGYFEYGLGHTTTLGIWKKFERDLVDDLQRVIEDAEILEVKNFVIKGNGFIDNIQIIKRKNVMKNVMKKKLLKERPKENSKNNSKVKIKHNQKTNTMPTIHLKGKNPLVLKKGEEYVEAGATALDGEGRTLNIEISHQIDILKEGEYSVIYMTTNHLGNSVIDTRSVIVGEVSTKKENVTKDDEEDDEENDNKGEESLNFDKRSEELLIWEEELKERERALSKQEIMKEKLKNKPPDGYPERPGV